jgi:hypothetical protein
MLGREPKSLLRIAMFFALLAALTPVTRADIHKCTDEYGNVAYLQTPCPARKEESTDTGKEADTDINNPERHEKQTEWPPELQSPAPQIPTSRQPGEALDDCKKRYRDQIDEIDDEMRATFSAEQGENFKQRLLALTRQLRACG